MAFLPLLFLILPTVQLLLVSASASSAKLNAHIGLALLYMLMIPAMVPSVLAAAIFAQPGAASAVFEGSHLLVQLLFTPLLAGWPIWAGIAISTQSADVRAGQQPAVLASLPPLGIVALMSFNVVVQTPGLALGLAAALLIADALGWRAVAPMFDRERLVTGTRS